MPAPTSAACSPYLPQQPGFNKRLPAVDLLGQVIRALASETTFWTDDVWVADSTPVECGRSRETTKRSALAGWAAYGYCASHSRWFWGLRLHLVCTLQGLPVGFALAGATADERQLLLGILAADPTLVATRPGQTLIADSHYYGRGFQAELVAQGCGCCARPARASRNRPLPTCSGRCGRSSSRSTRPSRASSTWNATVATPRQASSCGCCSPSWP